MTIPAAARNHSPWIEWVGRTSLILAFVFAFTHFAFPEVGKWAWRFLLLAGIAYCIASTPKKALTTPILLWLAAIFVQALSWALSQLHTPEIAESSLKIHRLSHCFTFILVGWTLKDYKNSWIQFWLIAALGIITTAWTRGDGWHEIIHGLHGNRTDLGFSNAQHTALAFGAVLIGLVIYSKRWLRFDKISVAARWFLLVSATTTVFLAIMIAQSRGILLGLGVAFATVTLTSLLGGPKPQRSTIRRASPIAATLIVFCVFIGFSLTALTDRWQKDIPTIESLADGDDTNIPLDSVGIRVTGWIEAFQWIEQRPFTGWGGNARKHVILNNPSFPESLKMRFHHLHNSYVELLVNYGIAGLGVILALYYWIFSASRTACKKKLIPLETYYFCVGFLAYWITVNQFESFMFFSSGRFVFAIVIGGIAAQIWQQHKTEHASSNPA